MVTLTFTLEFYFQTKILPSVIIKLTLPFYWKICISGKEKVRFIVQKEEKSEKRERKQLFVFWVMLRN